MSAVGPLGRLGRWTATHFRLVVAAWGVIALAAGILAPRVEHALSGAGWEATGSESVAVRDLVDRNFAGLSSSSLMVVVQSRELRLGDDAFDAAIRDTEAALRRSDAVRAVVPPAPGVSVSADRHTAVVQAGAARDSNGMVRAAEDLQDELGALGGAHHLSLIHI